MIIDDFSVFGKIKNYQLDPNGGNWVHVQFENKFQVFPSIFDNFQIKKFRPHAQKNNMEKCSLDLCWA